MVCAAQAGIAAPDVPIRRSHSTILHGAAIDYVAGFDTFRVSAPGSASAATITTISYVRANAPPDELHRPVVFAFNGGPGSSSIYLHAGMLGPERLDIPSEPGAPRRSHDPLVPNHDSILDVADIVLIDPVGTGFSRLTDEGSRTYFYSTVGDATAIASVVHDWSELHGRSASPKFLLGESYGAVRAVEVANLLERQSGASNLRGIVLVSQSLAIIDTIQRRGNITAQAVGLQAIAAAAWFHKLAGRGETLSAFGDRARRFAESQWLPALYAGTRLSPARREAVARGLASFAGLPAKYFMEHGLYLAKHEYRALALERKHLILGESDARYTAPVTGEKGQDPSAILSESFERAAPDLLRSQLGLEDVSDYTAHAKIPEWLYTPPGFDVFNRATYASIDFAGSLLTLMDGDRDLRVLMAIGWFDTTATVGADDYLLSRPGLALERVTHRRYVGGHMFYTDAQSRSSFAQELRGFLLQSSARPL